MNTDQAPDWIGDDGCTCGQVWVAADKDVREFYIIWSMFCPDGHTRMFIGQDLDADWWFF